MVNSKKVLKASDFNLLDSVKPLLVLTEIPKCWLLISEKRFQGGTFPGRVLWITLKESGG